MTRLLLIAKLVLLFVVTVVLIVGAAGYWMVATELSGMLASQRQNVTSASYNLAVTTWNLRQATGGLDSTIKEVQATSKTVGAFVAEVRDDYWDPDYPDSGLYWEILGALESSAVASHRTATTLATINDLMAGTSDKPGVLDSATALIRDTDNRLNGDKGTIPAMTDTVHQLRSVLLESAKSVQAAGDVFRNPNIGLAFDQFGSTSKHVNNTAAEFEETMGFIRDEFKPRKVPFWERIMTAAVAQALGLPLKFLPQRVKVINK